MDFCVRVARSNMPAYANHTAIFCNDAPNSRVRTGGEQSVFGNLYRTPQEDFII